MHHQRATGDTSDGHRDKRYAVHDKPEDLIGHQQNDHPFRLAPYQQDHHYEVERDFGNEPDALLGKECAQQHPDDMAALKGHSADRQIALHDTGLAEQERDGASADCRNQEIEARIESPGNANKTSPISDYTDE